MIGTIRCGTCGCDTPAATPRKLYCSALCGQRSRKPGPRVKNCRGCGAAFSASGKANCNRQYCSKRCAKAAHASRVGDWYRQNPDAFRRHRESRIERNPDHHREHGQKQRTAILELLGGKCAACGADNPHWLHVDYAPGTRGSRYRHPRHYAFVKAHRSDFRILCANHHYELTLTGKIDGTDIVQAPELVRLMVEA
ncbi:MAG: hypothetical protein JWQ97_992 [Phenylobacterium sp.]|nr:hypothetical protein [Phenylobacterium sp.]